MVARLLGIGLLISFIALNGVSEVDGQSRTPQMIDVASKITLELLNAPQLQGVSLEKRVLLLQRVINASLNPGFDTVPRKLRYYAKYTVAENTSMSVVIGTFTDYNDFRDFTYLFTRRGEKYSRQPFPTEWIWGGRTFPRHPVMAAKLHANSMDIVLGLQKFPMRVFLGSGRDDATRAIQLRGESLPWVVFVDMRKKLW